MSQPYEHTGSASVDRLIVKLTETPLADWTNVDRSLCRSILSILDSKIRDVEKTAELLRALLTQSYIPTEPDRYELPDPRD